ncbi:MAG: hypothetical protein WCP85_21100 [Mariniphaga sp.]
MTKSFIVPILVFFYFSVAGQTMIRNGITSEHINITGTKISLIPPAGFVKATNFLGLQHDQSGSSIMIIEIPGPFLEATKGFTKEGLLSQGVVLKDIERLIINSLPAILITGQQNAHWISYTKYIFSFGSGNETVMINGTFPQDLVNMGTEIKKSVLSAYFDINKKIDPFETVDFKIKPDQANLKFAKSVMNSLIFNRDGNMPSQSADKTSFIVAKAFSNVVIVDKKQFSMNRLKQTPYIVEQIETTKEITIGGLSGYEVIALCKDKSTNTPVKVIQIILFRDSLYYILFGSTSENYDANIRELKIIAMTFQIKQ